MFSWDVSKGTLTKERQMYGNKNLPFSLENEISTSREDKIAFVDARNDGRLSYIIGVIEKFNIDKENLPKDFYGNVKTVSLKAWIKRNDPRGAFDADYNCGKLRWFDERFLQNFSHKGAYALHDDFVDECFHIELISCQREEVKWFNEHDEYSVTMNTVLKKMRNGKFYTFGLNCTISCNEGLFLNDDKGNCRRLTLEELNTLIDMNNQVNELVKLMTEQNEIAYENPIGELPEKNQFYRN